MEELTQKTEELLQKLEVLLQKVPGDPAQNFYLVHQILISLVLGLILLWIGQMLAWLFWAPVKHRLKKVNANNAKLREQLK